jgi:hypothetical protein
MGRNNQDFHEARFMPFGDGREGKPVFTTNSSGTTSIDSNEVNRRVAGNRRDRAEGEKALAARIRKKVRDV